MFISWCLIICSFALLLFYIPAWKYLCVHVTCLHVIGAQIWPCCWQAAHSVDSAYSHAPLKAVRATQTTNPPPQHPTVGSPFPGPQRPAVACGWVLHPGCQRKGLLGIGLWWKCSIRACLSAPRSTSSWLSVLAGLQSVAQTYHDWLSLAWKWKDRPQNRHIHSCANEKEVLSNL